MVRVEIVFLDPDRGTEVVECDYNKLIGGCLQLAWTSEVWRSEFIPLHLIKRILVTGENSSGKHKKSSMSRFEKDNDFDF